MKTKSKKDEGNDFFKKQKYKEAIKCYDEYVKINHQDNSRAYSNMGLCYFKLLDYENCVNACQMAAELQPQFQKPFFRMYQAYRELKNNYGMITSGSKFCKLTKDEKDLQIMQKQLIKIKQELSFNSYRKSKVTDEDRLIDELLKLSEKEKTHERVQKQPQISLQSKWQKVLQKIKANKIQGFNLARRFINLECPAQDEKKNYQFLLSKIKQGNIQQQQTQKSNGSDSSYEDPKVEELQKYIKTLQKNHQNSLEQPKDTLKERLQVKIQNKSTENVNDSNKSTEKIQSSSNQKPVKSSIFSQEPTKWQQFVSEEQAIKLLEQHISSKLSKAEDPFTKFYEVLGKTIRSTGLDKFQKEAILSVAPRKVQKFKMLIKSYNHKEKEQLNKLITEYMGVKMWKQYL